MRRREFIGCLGSAAVWPLAADAQKQSQPVIGFLRSTSLAPFEYLGPAFGEGLKEAGFVDRQNCVIEERYAGNQVERLPALVSELISQRVAGNNLGALAAKSLSNTVPIIFVTGGDPVHEGLVGTLSRPGGNVTGISFFAGVLGSKRLDIIRRLSPAAATIGVLANPRDAETAAELQDVQQAAQTLEQQLLVRTVSNPQDIEAAFTGFVEAGVGALLVGVGAFMDSQRGRVLDRQIAGLFAIKNASNVSPSLLI